MRRAWQADSTATEPTVTAGDDNWPAANAADQYPQGGDAATGREGTKPGWQWFHMVTEAIVTTIEQAISASSISDASPDDDPTQFRDAITGLIDDRSVDALATEAVFGTLTRGATTTWNVGDTPNAQVTLNGNVSTLTVTGGASGGVYTLLIIQDATGGRTFAFPSGWRWAGGSAGSIADGAGERTILTIRQIGTNIYAAPLLADVS